MPEPEPVTTAQAVQAFGWLSENIITDQASLGTRLHELAPPPGEARGSTTQGRQQEAAAREMMATLREAEQNMRVVHRYLGQDDSDIAALQPGMDEGRLAAQLGGWRFAISTTQDELRRRGFRDTTWKQAAE